jgi:Uma2 family endonuclease
MTQIMQSESDYEQLTRQADAAGVRLEVVRGLAVWEAQPVYRHQRAVARIYESIRPASNGAADPCACIAAMDVSIRFPDGSHKRPDLSIFCREPDEQDREITLMPEAVVEVLSEDYEAKDLLIGVPFYQQIGVKDITVLDPRTGEVRHYQQGRPPHFCQSPTQLTFLCGCTATV